MDDSTFDDLLRRKLKDYSDPSFDPAALEDLHERMQGHTSVPWYSNRVMQFAIAALVAISAINSYLLLNTDQPKIEIASTQNQADNGKTHTIDSLKRVISQLQCESETKPFVNQPTSISHTNFKLKLITVADYKEDSINQSTVLKLGIGRTNSLPKEVYHQLKEEGWLSEENGEAFLNLTHEVSSDYPTTLHTSKEDLLVKDVHPPLFRIMSTNTKPEEKKIGVPIKRQGESSLEARNTLEKHYYKGVGIQVAPHLDLAKGIFEEGKGLITPRVGVTADWIFSPHISLESGLDYSTMEVSLNSNEIHFNPGYSPYGTLESAIVTNKVFSTPLAFKYRRWISDKSQLVWKTTLTPYWLLSRTLQSDYVHHTTNYPDADGDHVTMLDKRDEFKFFGSTVGTSLGLTLKREKDKGTWEASLFYEHGVGNMNDQNNLQLVGLRTAYWFKIK